ncbi:MAG: ArsB/NhaD family transporter [Vampirovibrio sp.]|nr:ArsB/NhaD family transporter [Vampirovibrio sp.]
MSAAATLSPQMAMLPNIVLVLAYIFISLEKVPKVVIALLAASLMMITHVVSQEEAFASVDWNVIFLLVGMMIMVNILKETGAIRYLALMAAKSVDGSGMKLMLVFATITAVLSAFLDNVTAVLLIGSVTTAIASRLNISPVPYLVAVTLSSNIGGTATLIGDPPNIMVGSASGLSFYEFLVNLAPVIIVIYPICMAVVAWIYRNDLKLPDAAKQEMADISLHGVITDKGLMIKSILVLLLVVSCFVVHHIFHLEPGTIALAGASILLLFENKKHIWDDVEWTTIFFFIGLFILIGAVEKVGTIEYLAERFFDVTQGDFTIMTIALLWMSGVLSAIIDNIPYTATMIPLVKQLGIHNPEITLEPLWWSLALGACLGGNGTMIGASANVLVADMAHRHGHPIYFLQFMKIGGLIMVISLAISSVYMWLRYLM